MRSTIPSLPQYLHDEKLSLKTAQGQHLLFFMNLTTHLHLVQRSGIRGTIPPISQYVFMEWYLVKHKDFKRRKRLFHSYAQQ
jgi:hypothetical protein